MVCKIPVNQFLLIKWQTFLIQQISYQKDSSTYIFQDLFNIFGAPCSKVRFFVAGF